MVEFQRARLLSAMVELCGEHGGVGNVSVAHVVARAGVSRRTFYDLFTDREDCFLSAFEDALGQTGSVVLRGYGSEGVWRERVRTALGALLGFLDARPELARVLIVDALSGGPLVLERRAQALRALAMALERDASVAGAAKGSAGAGRRSDPGARRSAGEASLTGEGIVGAVFSVIHARLLEQDNGHPARRARDRRPGPLLGLLNPLMGMIVTPYLGRTVARRELQRRAPPALGDPAAQPHEPNPLRDLDIRLTYRTITVLLAISEHPGSSNRRIGDLAGVPDQGQISKLLGRLHRLGLIQNTTAPDHPPKGTANHWTLTPKGKEIQHAIGGQTQAEAFQPSPKGFCTRTPP